MSDHYSKGNPGLALAEALHGATVNLDIGEEFWLKVFKGGADPEQGIMGEVRDDPSIPFDVFGGVAAAEESHAQLATPVDDTHRGGVTLGSNGTTDVTDTINVIRDQ